MWVVALEAHRRHILRDMRSVHVGCRVVASRTVVVREHVLSGSTVHRRRHRRNRESAVVSGSGGQHSVLGLGSERRVRQRHALEAVSEGCHVDPRVVVHAVALSSVSASAILVVVHVVARVVSVVGAWVAVVLRIGDRRHCCNSNINRAHCRMRSHVWH